MAAKKNGNGSSNTGIGTAGSNSSAGTSAGGTAPATHKGGRQRGVPAPPTLVWTNARITALVMAVAAEPGSLTAAQIADRLSVHPAFAGDEKLVTADRVRLKIAKVNAINEKKGRPALGLRRTSNSGVDLEGVLDQIYGGPPAPIERQIVQPQAPPQPLPVNLPNAGFTLPVQPSTPFFAPAPGAATSSTPLPIFTPPGGLIPG